MERECEWRMKGFSAALGLFLFLIAANGLMGGLRPEAAGAASWKLPSRELEGQEIWLQEAQWGEACWQGQTPDSWVAAGRGTAAGRGSAAAVKKQTGLLQRLALFLYGLSVWSRAYGFSERTLLAACIRLGGLYPARFLHELLIEQKKDGKK